MKELPVTIHECARLDVVGRRGIAFSLLACLAVYAVVADLPRLEAQTPTCACTDTAGFGSCAVATADYPGQDPGATALVPVNDETFLYISDASDGFTYRFRVQGNQITTVGCTPANAACFPSPLGSLPTPTGIAYRGSDDRLYWAIGGSLFRTIPDISDPSFLSSRTSLGAVNLEMLAELLELPQVGRLGGITYHPGRDSFWGVDVVNGVYFEFDLLGQPIVSGGQVQHFRSPTFESDGPAAYGDTITYASVSDDDFFDIAVGRFIDGATTTVERIRAGFETLGQSTGRHYSFAPFSGEGGRVAGLSHVSDACGAGKHGEIFVEVENPETGAGRIYLVKADVSSGAGLTQLECSSEGSTIQISWNASEDYSLLEIVREDLLTGRSLPVATIENGPAGDDTRTFSGIPDGSYGFVATLTASDGTELASRSCSVVVGPGTIVASTSFLTELAPNDEVPFAMAYIDTLDVLCVADFDTGFAHLYDTDLQLVGIVEGPYSDTGLLERGLTTGLAWLPATEELVWLLSLTNGANRVQSSKITRNEDGTYSVDLIGDSAHVVTPLNLIRPELGDISYDPLANQFWTVDRRNGVGYSFNIDGSLSGDSFMSPLVNPLSQNRAHGLSGGGVAVVDSTSDQLTLQWIAGAQGSTSPTILARASHSRSLQDETDAVESAGRGLPLIELATATNSLRFGGIAPVTIGETPYQFLVAWDTKQIFKLSMEEGISGREFVRGDANADGMTNISDPSHILNFLFKNGAPPPCEDSADVDDDEAIDISDAVVLFRYLFLQDAAPPAPISECGLDPSGEQLGCDVAACP